MRHVRIRVEDNGRARFMRRPLWGFTPVLDLEVHESDDLVAVVCSGRAISAGSLADCYYNPVRKIDDASMWVAREYCRDADRTKSAFFHPGMDAFWDERAAELERQRRAYQKFLADLAAGRINHASYTYRSLANDWARRRRLRREELERERKAWAEAQRREAKAVEEREKRWNREQREWADAAVELELKRAEGEGLTEAGREATIVDLWVRGYTQKQIAKAFGYAGSSKINQVIMRFCVKYAPEKTEARYYDQSIVLPTVYGDERRELAKSCLSRFRKEERESA